MLQAWFTPNVTLTLDSASIEMGKGLHLDLYWMSSFWRITLYSHQDEASEAGLCRRRSLGLQRFRVYAASRKKWLAHSSYFRASNGHF